MQRLHGRADKICAQIQFPFVVCQERLNKCLASVSESWSLLLLRKEHWNYLTHYYLITNQQIQANPMNHSTLRFSLSLGALWFRRRRFLTSWPMRSRLSRKYFTDSPWGKGKTWQLSLFLGQIQQNQGLLPHMQWALTQQYHQVWKYQSWEEIWTNAQIYPVNLYNKCY